LIEKWVSETPERFEREIWKNGWSEQAPDHYLFRRDMAEVRMKMFNEWKEHGELKNLPKRKIQAALNKHLASLTPNNNPMMFSPEFINWGQRQDPNDHVSFTAALAQRIRRSNFDLNKADHMEAIPLGCALWDHWKEYLGFDRYGSVAFNQNEFDLAEAQFMEKRTYRSDALKQAGFDRADPDFTDRLTAKKQWKLKDIVPAKAKALQVILIRADEYLEKWGPRAQYLKNKFLEICPPYLYLHTNKTYQQMQDWSSWRQLTFGSADIMTELDITALDTHERGGSLEFEIRFMRFFSFPEEWIEEYVYDKYHFHTSSIWFGLMRFSGEAFTFFFNSMFMGARTVTKYAIAPGACMKLAGDDVLLFDKYVVRQSWDKIKHLDAIDTPEDGISKEKYFEVKVGGFCSFSEKDGMVWKNPIILLKRLLSAAREGRIKDVIDGYYLDFLTIYRHEDRLYEVLSEDEMAAQQVLASEIFNAKRRHGARLKYAEKMQVGFEGYDPGFITYVLSMYDAALKTVEANPYVSEYTSSESDVITQLYEYDY